MCVTTAAMFMLSVELMKYAQEGANILYPVEKKKLLKIKVNDKLPYRGPRMRDKTMKVENGQDKNYRV